MNKLLLSLANFLPAEFAHNLAISMIAKKIVTHRINEYSKDLLSQKIFGQYFAHPLGLAAGFDKNGQIIQEMLGNGFAFVEIGAATIRPQIGSNKPRLFRLPKEKSIINRMGFNNDGSQKILDNIQSYLDNRVVPGILGINIGPNKDSANFIDDYIKLIKVFAPYTNFITLNVSSPNTPNLRRMESLDEFANLVDEISDISSDTPILVKISSDLNDLTHQKQIADILTSSKQISGIIVSNTTVERPNINNKYANIAGGLSGKAIFSRSTNLLNNLYLYSEGKIPIIGVGGISSGEDAYCKIRHGASLLQIYTSLIYEGFDVIDNILGELELLLQRDGFTHISQAVGISAKDLISNLYYSEGR